VMLKRDWTSFSFNFSYW